MAQRQDGSGAGEKKPKFAELNNLISEKLGGRILFATDDWFAVAENLIKESDPEWREGEFTECGKWMDGWETRRKRIPGHDWCIIKLGVPGIIEGIDADTSFFTGNFVPRVSLQGAALSPEDEAKIPPRKSEIGTQACEGVLEQVSQLRSQDWPIIVPLTEARPGYVDTCHTYIEAVVKSRWTHVRLNIFPDGGIARLKVFGRATPDWALVPKEKLIDLAAVENGGVCLEYSDAHYGHPRNLISPGRGVTMADGWETARRLDRPAVLQADSRGVLQVPGFEWAVLRLGHPGVVTQVEVDTHHFKGNFPDSCRIDGCLLQGSEDSAASLGTDEGLWRTVLQPQKLKAHARHFFSSEVQNVGPISHVRIVMSPDGGISRVRIIGTLFSMASKL
ncbi:allantoicase-like [Penaeus japonicus]|uniref:allantoicase-like n=1 Tax=Penaeus japonicus TaxID=27405 RepID=UPI001C715D8B|nr:allantoicase-like [Penaeus japonicus]